jgi:hypothetical protein
MMCIESSSELRSVDALRFFMGFYISTDVAVVALHHFQLLLNRLEPIISIHRLHNIRKDWWLNAENLPTYPSAAVALGAVHAG